VANSQARPLFERLVGKVVRIHTTRPDIAYEGTVIRMTDDAVHIVQADGSHKVIDVDKWRNVLTLVQVRYHPGRPGKITLVPPKKGSQPPWQNWRASYCLLGQPCSEPVCCPFLRRGRSSREQRVTDAQYRASLSILTESSPVLDN
jgi:hypothetical protein